MSHKYVFLKEVCEKASSNISQKDLAECDGIYPIYGASGYIKSVDFFQQAKDYIAIVKDGAGIGRAMKLPAKSSVIGTMQYVLPKDNINISYLYYAICSMHLEKYFSGATIPHIYFRDYQNEQLPLPSLEEQAKIANVFGRIDYFIKKEKEQLINLDKLVKSRFIEMFGENKSKNHFGKLSDVCLDIIAGGDRPNEISYEQTEEYCYPVFANARTNNGLLYYAKSYKIASKAVTIAARGATVGFTAIRDSYFTPIVRLITLIPNKSINVYYMKYYIDYNLRIVSSGSAQPQLTVPYIKNLKILIPTSDMQNQFASFVMQVDKSKFVVTAKFQ